jgi:predicted TIM-barrel fold metal-dependent hydrolase
MINIDIDELLTGSIDMHMHPGPTGGPCRLDALEAARQAKQAKMMGIVLKSHSYTASAMAIIVSQLVPDILVFGSVCLDYEIGGLNPHAVENAAQLGAKIVWMPTFSSTNSINKMRALGLPLKGKGLSLIDDTGKLVPEINPILTLIKERNMILATGHISPQETFILLNEAKKIGIKKFIITHPTDAEFSEKHFSIDELQRLAKMGAFIEFTLVGMLPNEFCHNPAQITQAIKDIGAKHCIISTDLGQPQNPLPVEGMRLLIATLLKHGISKEEVELMAKRNPAILLDLDKNPKIL